MMNSLIAKIRTALRGSFESDTASKQVTKLPLVTLAISISALGIGLLNPIFPMLSWLCFDFTLITEEHQYWRLITAHLVHSSTEHLFWDLITFAVAGIYLERSNFKLYISGLGLSLMTLSIFLLSPLTDIAQYSGLSGVLYTIICLAAWQWLKEETGLIAWLPLLTIILKTVAELFMQDTVFVSEGWEVFSEAHIVGAGTALIIGAYKMIRYMKWIKVFTLITATILITACSVAAYSPVVGYSILGLDKDDLSNQPDYAPYIGPQYQLRRSDNTSWFLKRFKGGRYTIEIGVNHEQKVRICDLTQPGNTFEINQIYFNQAYGQEFYSAQVSCNETNYEVLQSMWGEHLKPYLVPVNTKKRH